MLIRHKTITFLATIRSLLMAANKTFGQSSHMDEQQIHPPASS